MNIYDIKGVSGYTPKVEERKPKQSLDQEDFLALLVAQMQNQDPLSPMDDKEMVAQMAQFSLLEQMRSLNQSFQSVQALSLLGKTVYAEIYKAATGEITPATGKVDRVFLRNGEVVIGIGSEEATMEDIKEVYESHE